MKSVNSICDLIAQLRSFATNHNENFNNLYMKGFFADGLVEQLCRLGKLINTYGLSQYFVLNIDGDRIPSDEIEDTIFQSNHAEFELTFKKKSFIQEIYSVAGDIDEILYCSLETFKSDLGGLGLSSPLIEGAINNGNNTRIHVYQMDVRFGGSKLAVVPTECVELGDDWLSGSKLPASAVIHKHVHVVSSAPLKIDPQQFELTWGAIDCELAKPYRLAFAKHLFVSLCTNYYSDEKIEFKGIKHIEAELKADSADVSSHMLQSLSQSISWCYEKEDPDIPLQLIIDRLSLECSSGNLFTITQKTVSFALEQAKNNYKFVIAKRSDDYRKELKEIYKDVQSVTDKFADKAFSLASELLKSLLAIGFIFTVGTVSKAVVHSALLHSPEGKILFKIAGIYLVLSFFIRWLNASADLKVSESALKSWSGKLHNHISTQEINKLINSRIKWSKRFYLVSLAVVTMLQICIAYLVFDSENTLMLLGLNVR
jgi:hypothetical protein